MQSYSHPHQREKARRLLGNWEQTFAASSYFSPAVEQNTDCKIQNTFKRCRTAEYLIKNVKRYVQRARILERNGFPEKYVTDNSKLLIYSGILVDFGIFWYFGIFCFVFLVASGVFRHF